ncbi:MAG: Fur family transcriptional regulator [Peptoniphilus sp.]|nr:Fur family transcriptional regulator [Peptoniphilus sp.]MDD7363495.1 Fur family transcriptional regulator [Bacillota bacterium]MDY6044801.1 Fur family transcriptional regulator [Peptoniphilus sp.]
MEQLLRQHGLKATKGRIEVLRLLKEAHTPMCASDVYKLTSKHTTSSLSTVYRILNQLTDIGLLEASVQQEDVTYYEYKEDEHNHYIVCSSCGKFTPIHNCPLDDLDDHIIQSTGYTITGHSFQLEGICPDCQKKLNP